MAGTIPGLRSHLASGALACLTMLGTPGVSPAQAPPAHNQHLRGPLGLPRFDVRSIGARNGGATDGTAAIQATLDAADSAGGRSVMIPRETYRITRAAALTTDRPIELATELGAALDSTASEAELLLTSGAGRTFYVAPGGSDSADGSALRPWATIQKAANTVAAGDTVHVAAGTYNSSPITTNTSGTSSAPITFISDIKWGAKIVWTGKTGSYGWTVNGNYTTIQGFDITGDGRIGIINYASYCKFIGNYIHDIPVFDVNGGQAINNCNYAAGNNDIIGNLVENIGTANPANWGAHGYAFYLANYGGTCVNNIVIHTAYFGIHCWHASSHVTIANNLVMGCGGDGILVGDGDAPYNVTNDYTIVSNNISIYNASYGVAEYGATGTHNQYLNNLVYGNRLGAFSLQNGLTAQGTVTADPQTVFVNYQSDGTGNYHLRSGSPAIDAGTSIGAPTTDYDGHSRPIGAGFDIGPYEWVPPTDDTSPPTVTSRNPASGATGVSTGSTVSATFSEAVQSGTISFVLKNSSGTGIASSVSYNPSNLVVTLTPNSPLVFSTTYTTTLSGVKDLTGNTMNTVSWSFTTGARQ